MIQAHQSTKEISFRVSGDTFEQVQEWTYRIDERVFNEQLLTGYFRDHKLDSDTLALMKRVKEQGGIMPYYGVGGSRGVCLYQFQILPTESKLTVIHYDTQETVEFGAKRVKVNEMSEVAEGRRLKFSPMPYLVTEKLPEAWSGHPPETLTCRITGRELEKLIHWTEWDENFARSERYLYEFGEVSMGTTGFTVTVKNTETGTIINITDYDDW
jgi:hypothetical protein